MSDQQEDAGAAPRPEPGSVSGAVVDDRAATIEALPLAERAAGFEAAHDALLAELQRGDRGEH